MRPGRRHLDEPERAVDASMADLPSEPPGPSAIVEYAAAQALPVLRARERSGIGIPSDTFPGYAIVAVIRRGGQGVVYRAIEMSTGRTVAIKVLRDGLFASETERSRFRQEVDVLAKLHMPGVVPIHRTGVVRDHLYYVMDFIEGVGLDEFVRREHPDASTCLTLMLRICRVVQAAHVMGIVHRDLKPGNVCVSADHEPYVLDFGLVKPISDASTDEDLTNPGQFVGTPRWAAPEQFDASKIADVRTDVYALGLLLHLVVTGRSPPAELTRDPDRDGIDMPSRSGRSMPRDLGTVISTCLRRDPDDRYQSVQYLIDDLERVRQGEPIEARRDGLVAVAIGKAHRNRRLLFAFGIALVLATAYGALVSTQLQRTRRAETEASLRLHETRDALSFLVRDVSESLVSVPEAREVRRSILDGAYIRLRRLAESAPPGSLDEELMEAQFELGRVAIEVGSHEAAIQHLDASLTRRLESEGVLSADRDALIALSLNHILLGDTYSKVGENALVDHHYELALAVDERLVGAHPDDAHLQDNLAWSYGRVAKRIDRTDPARALELVRQRRAIARRLVEADPDHPIRVHGLASAISHMSTYPSRAGRWDRASALLGEAVRLSHHATELDPENWHLRFTYASHVYWYGYLASKAGADFNLRQAEIALRDVDRMLDRTPHDASLVRCRLKLLALLIDRPLHLGRMPSVRHATRFVEEFEVRWDEFSDHDRSWFAQREIVALLVLRTLHLREGEPRRAASMIEQANICLERSAPLMPSSQHDTLRLLVSLHQSDGTDTTALMPVALRTVKKGCDPMLGSLIAHRCRRIGPADVATDVENAARRLYTSEGTAPSAQLANRGGG